MCRRRSSAVTTTAGSEPPSTTRARSRSTLALARAFAEKNRPTERPIVFVSHTAEEYGIADSSYDWCYGAWYQIVAEHPEWSTDAAFYLNIEGSGSPHPFTLDTPPSYAGGSSGSAAAQHATDCFRTASSSQRRRRGPKCGPFSPRESPGSTSRRSPPRSTAPSTTPSTTRPTGSTSTTSRVLRKCARACCDDADAGAADELDFAARARDVSRSLDGTQHRALTPALGELEHASGRARFTAIGRGLHGLDARESARYPHEQTAADVARLEEALVHLRAGKTGLAARSLARVGLNWLCADLGHEAFRIELARRGVTAPRATWAALGTPMSARISGTSSPRSAGNPVRVCPGRGSRSASRSTWRPRGRSSNDASGAWPRPRPGGSSPCPWSERRICLHESSRPSSVVRSRTAARSASPRLRARTTAAPRSCAASSGGSRSGYRVKLADGVLERDDYVAGDRGAARPT